MMQLSMASDKISKLRQPVLLLQLKLHQNEQAKATTVTIELTKDELDSLIAKLEGVNQVCVLKHTFFFGFSYSCWLL
jgi:hypothetical protein